MATVVGPLHVRRSVLIHAHPQRVWQEFSSTERIRSWFGLGHTLHELEPEVGGRSRFSVQMDGRERFFGGEVQHLEPMAEITLTSNWEDADMAFAVPTLWTIRLTPIYGHTQVEIFHHGFERLGADAADLLEGYESGWDIKHLEQLRRIVES